MSTISALMRETPERSLTPFYYVRAQQNGVYELGSRLLPASEPAGVLILDLVSRTVRNTIL